MQNFDNKKLIAAAVIVQNGKVLIAQRAKHDELFGKWEFPGGKVELGETLHECLKRELNEELSIQPVIGQYLCTSSFNSKNMLFDMHVFQVTSFSGTITLNEHSAIAWVDPLNFCQYEFLEPDLPIIDLLVQNKFLV